MDERLDTVFFYLFFAVETQLFFDLELNGESVRIPSGFSRHHVSFHGAVSRDHVLYDTRQHMPDMRLSVRGRRSVVKSIDGAAAPLLYALLKYIVLIPKIEYILFP